MLEPKPPETTPTESSKNKVGSLRSFSFRTIEVDGLTPEKFEPLRRQIRILYVLLVALFVPLMGMLVLIKFVAPTGVQDNYRLLIVFCTILNIFALLLLRYGYVKAAAQTLVAMTMFAPWFSAVFDPNILMGDFIPLLYFIFSILLSALFLSVWETVVVALVQYLLLVYVLFSTGLHTVLNAPTLLIFVFLLGLFVVIINHVREVNLNQLTEQALQLEKSRRNLKQQTILDPLTGLYNSLYLDTLMEEELRFAEENGTSLGFLMLDLDHFQRINDTYGHDVGDRVLREIAQAITTNIRQTDYLVRYGGDELVLVMPGAPLDVAQRRAEQFRKTIEKMVIPLEGQVVDSVTISIGLAAYPNHGMTQGALSRAAEQALAQAKASGRNRVVVAE